MGISFSKWGRGRWVSWFALLAGVAVVLMCVTATVTAQQSPTLQKQVSQTSAYDHFIKGGGLITYVILLPLSMLTVGLCIDHFIHIRRGALLPDPLKLTLGALIQERKYKEVLEHTATDRSLLASVLHSGLSQANSGLPVMERAMEEVMETRAAGLFRRIEYLNIIGNVSPMIGLFGTVYGMIKTFSTIVEQGGSPDPKALAEGISIALVTTFWGLLVAIPALSVFHLMRNRIDGLLAECAIEAEAFIQYFKPVGRGTLKAIPDAPKRPATGARPGTVVPGRTQA